MNHPQRLNFIRWEPPQEGWVKLNSDGAREIAGNASYRGLIIGNTREWLGRFAKRIGICSSYIAELWGVFEGVRLTLNVDYLQVAEDINAKDAHNNMGRNLISKIKFYMQQEVKIIVRHSYHKANLCEDALAKSGLSQPEGMRTFDVCPSFMNHLLESDLLGLFVSHLTLV